MKYGDGRKLQRYTILCPRFIQVVWYNSMYSTVMLLLITIRLDDMERLRQQDKDTINRQNQQLADYESELNMLRRRVNGLEQDLEHEASENKRLQEELFKTVQVRECGICI